MRAGSTMLDSIGSVVFRLIGYKPISMASKVIYTMIKIKKSKRN